LNIIVMLIFTDKHHLRRTADRIEEFRHG